MIVWGGRNSSGSLQTGGQYDPATDTWTPTSTIEVTANSGHGAIWTGTEMIVLGGEMPGGRYNPATDTWAPTISPSPLVVPHSPAVWTGTHVLTYGGEVDEFGTVFPAGVRYDPMLDSWSPLSLTNAPEPYFGLTAIWTGQEMIVWGGAIGFGKTNTGGRYDPGTDTWLPTSLVNAPEERSGHTAVWTGSQMLIWGGSNYADVWSFTTGGRYDPPTDSWTPTSLANACGSWGDGEENGDWDLDSLQVEIPSVGSLLLSWSRPSLPAGFRVFGYRLWQADSPTGPWVFVAQTSWPEYEMPVPGIALRFYQVRAIGVPPD